MDNRLVIPQTYRAMIMCSLLYGHPGRDAMLTMVADFWCLWIHREVTDHARLCHRCLEAGKNLKCIQKQGQVGKLPQVNDMNAEIGLGFAGPFQNAKQRKKRKKATFLHSQTAKKVFEILKRYISCFGVPKTIRTDTWTVCPVRDHRGNGKNERSIRTINERLRANKQVVLTKDKSVW